MNKICSIENEFKRDSDGACVRDVSRQRLLKPFDLALVCQSQLSMNRFESARPSGFGYLFSLFFLVEVTNYVPDMIHHGNHLGKNLRNQVRCHLLLLKSEKGAYCWTLSDYKTIERLC